MSFLKSVPASVQALASLINKAYNISVFDLVDALHRVGDLDPMAALTDDGEHFLAFWIRQADDAYHLPEPKDLAQFDAWTQGAIWSTTNRQGETLLELWLQKTYGSLRHETLDQTTAWLVERTPLSTLQTWSLANALKKRPYGGFDRNNTFKGQSLLTLFLHEGSLHALQALVQRGGSLTSSAALLPANAAGLSRPEHWDLYLAQGGDPNLPISRHEKPAQPLWENLMQGTYSSYTTEREHLEALKAHVESWAATHLSEAKQERDNRLYWDSLKFGPARGCVTRMKKRSDWPTQVDPDGRSAMMRCLMIAPAYSNFYDVQKSALGAAHLDREGCSLWPYFLANSAAITQDAVKWLVRHVPFVRDRHGNGVFWQSLKRCASENHLDVSDESMFSEEKLRRASFAKLLFDEAQKYPSAVRLIQAQPLDFFGDAAAQQRLAHWLTEHAPPWSTTPGILLSKSTSLLPKNINPIGEKLSSVIAALEDVSMLDPHLLGALVAHEMFQVDLQPDTQGAANVNRLIDAGAKLVISPARRALLGRNNAPNAFIQQSLNRMEATELHEEVARMARPDWQDPAPKARL